MRVRLLILILSVLLISRHARADQVPQAALDAARNGLQLYAQLVNDQNYAELGFSSRDEIRTALLGAPYREYMIQLNDIKSYQAGTNASTLLKGAESYIFPVQVSNVLRSSLTVTNRGSNLGRDLLRESQ